MILEIAQLQVKPELTAEFESAFNKAQTIIASMPGYLGHELQKCIEQVNHYMLLVRWESVEHHEVGFRKSAQYQQWRTLLHHFYDPFPTVLHYELANGPGMSANEAG
ncbi:MAG: antibiotic biosynthesis monooxygenase [Cytophagaceae bacterium]|nr:MAG: antibiotic biosynthesis monooxygenase [Cytophagaceae bacterium]